MWITIRGEWLKDRDGDDDDDDDNDDDELFFLHGWPTRDV